MVRSEAIPSPQARIASHNDGHGYREPQAAYGVSAPGFDRDQDAVLEIEIAAPSIDMLLADMARQVHAVDRDRLRPAGFFRFRFRHADLRLAEFGAVRSWSSGQNLRVFAEEVDLVIGAYVAR